VEQAMTDRPEERVHRGAASDTGTLGKTMAVLELVVTADMPLRFTDILALSGQPRGTLHRQLSHLVLEGLLVQRDDLSYEPGLRLLTFAHRAWSRNDLRILARPHLDRLHRETGETVHLGVLLGTGIVYLDKVESRQTVRMTSQIGKVSPVYCTGLGKAALSVLPPERLTDILGRLRFDAFTAATHRSAASLLADIETIRRQGYAFDAEEHETGIRCIAAPLPLRGSAQIGGISITAPAYRVTMSQLEAWGPLITASAREIGHVATVAMEPAAPLCISDVRNI
jgi:DNA-binding IclR family transcriptional regulator